MINLVILRIFLEISIDMIDIQLSPPSPNLKFLGILRKFLVEPLLQESMDQIRAWAVKDTSCQSSGDSVTGDDKDGYQKLHPGNLSEMVVTGQKKVAGKFIDRVTAFWSFWVLKGGSDGFYFCAECLSSLNVWYQLYLHKSCWGAPSEIF